MEKVDTIAKAHNEKRDKEFGKMVGDSAKFWDEQCAHYRDVIGGFYVVHHNAIPNSAPTGTHDKVKTAMSKAANELESKITASHEAMTEFWMKVNEAHRRTFNDQRSMIDELVMRVKKEVASGNVVLEDVAGVGSNDPTGTAKELQLEEDRKMRDRLLLDWNAVSIGAREYRNQCNK